MARKDDEELPIGATRTEAEVAANICPQKSDLAEKELPEIVRKIRERTPARLLAGRAGSSYRTGTQLDLRQAHAAPRDAVRAELGTHAAFGKDFVRRWGLFDTYTEAKSKDKYLLRPDLGRRFDRTSREKIVASCSAAPNVQIAIGDGLSVAAVVAQVPRLLPLLMPGAESRGWSVGRPFVIHHCRVAILGEIGELLDPTVAILLIGERPGLATAESLSAYMGYRPRDEHTDANRNLISNIHGRGVSPEEAALRVLNLAAQMMRLEMSGSEVREEFPVIAKQI